MTHKNILHTHFKHISFKTFLCIWSFHYIIHSWHCKIKLIFYDNRIIINHAQILCCFFNSFHVKCLEFNHLRLSQNTMKMKWLNAILWYKVKLKIRVTEKLQRNGVAAETVKHCRLLWNAFVAIWRANDLCCWSAVKQLITLPYLTIGLTSLQLDQPIKGGDMC